MVSLEKIAHLIQASSFDSLGPKVSADPDKLGALGAGTRYDVCASSFSSRSPKLSGICHSFTHDGRCVSLFKTLYTNHCTHECSYCMNATTCSKKPKIFSYSPEELTNLTLSLFRSNYIEGLFLSSGSGRDGDQIMEKMVETLHLLRHMHNFQGYIHLKILPGASPDRIQEAMELADRVSINVEACSASHMNEISSSKHYENDIIQRQKIVRDLMEKVRVPAGQTTQLVVGAAGETDQEIFDRVLYEYREIGIKRTYYSAFCPLDGTPLQSREPQPLWREHRLYQVDWLYRIYRFSPQEIAPVFGESGFLTNEDPKQILARDLIDSPVDPNTAPYQELIRVPGIGPKSAWRIVALRKQQRIQRMKELAALGVRIKKASSFLKINGWRGTTLEMWSS